jgi:hypothetical protein
MLFKESNVLLTKSIFPLDWENTLKDRNDKTKSNFIEIMFGIVKINRNPKKLLFYSFLILKY